MPGVCVESPTRRLGGWKTNARGIIQNARAHFRRVNSTVEQAYSSRLRPWSSQCEPSDVQMATDEIVDMVAVRNSGMAAVGFMHVALRVAAAFYVRRARTRMVPPTDKLMLFDLAIGQGMMQMSIVQIVDVP